MAHLSKPSNEPESVTTLRDLVEPDVVGLTTRYLRRLIIEAPYIMARLHNPGGSILLMPTANPDQVQYGTTIGNDAHLDLIEAGAVLKREFSKGERDLLYQWALGFTSSQAAEYNGMKDGAIRKRRERVIYKLESRMNGGQGTRGNGDGIAQAGVPQEGVKPEKGWDTGRTPDEASAEEGNTDERD